MDTHNLHPKELQAMAARRPGQIPHLATPASLKAASRDALQGNSRAVRWLRHQLIAHELWLAIHQRHGLQERAEGIREQLAQIVDALQNA